MGFELLAIPLAGVALVWIGAVALLTLGQRFLTYLPPKRLSVAPSWMQEARQDGRLLGWWCPPANADGVALVIFHGNRGTLERIAEKAECWRAKGLGLFAATYPGYEGNGGKPCERTLYEAGRLALHWLAAQGLKPERTVLYGESLGSGVAVQLASERKDLGLILEAPFASIATVASMRYPFAPIRLLMRDRYDNAGKIGLVSCPILILHGEDDRTIPIVNAEILKKAAPQARLARFANARHINLYEHGAVEIVNDFLSKLRR